MNRREIACPRCGTVSYTTRPPALDRWYRCGVCKAELRSLHYANLANVWRARWAQLRQKRDVKAARRGQRTPRRPPVTEAT